MTNKEMKANNASTKNTKEEALTISDFHCDICNLPSFAEIFNSEAGCWWYECLPHFLLRRSWRNNGWSLADWLYHLPLVSRIWNWWAK